MSEAQLQRTVLVTGASSGIGAACAQHFLSSGDRLLMVGRNRPSLDYDASVSRFISCDLSDAGTYVQVGAEIKREIGTLHGCVLAAGAHAIRPLLLESPESLESLWRLNVLGTIGLVTSLMKSRVIARGASLVLFSSAAASSGGPGLVSYSSTKAAIEAATRSMALEFAAQRIRVNAVAPGVVRTPMTERYLAKMTSDQSKALEARHPLGFGEPDDIVGLVAFLLSEKARWITGSVISVDGGFSLG